MTCNLRGSVLITRYFCAAREQISILELRKIVRSDPKRILTSVCDPIKLRDFVLASGFRDRPQVNEKNRGM